jgi:hypothetical protein
MTFPFPPPKKFKAKASSQNERRTRRMADGALDLTVKLLGLAKLAVLKPIRTKVLLLLRQADLLPGSESKP